MSTICTGNGSVSNLTNGFQEASITAASSKTLLSNIEQGRKNTTNSFRSSSSRADDNRDWNSFINGNQDSFFMSEDKEEEEEFRQEWSDEHFTQIYIQNQLQNRHSTSQSSFVQEFLRNSDDTNQKMSTTFSTDHCDLFQAQLYLFDHLLSTILTYPITSTRRPSSTAEWNWTKLFSPTRWCDKEEEESNGDNILQNEYKHVAIGRLKLLFGHLAIDNKQKEKPEWEWEWEFYNS